MDRPAYGISITEMSMSGNGSHRGERALAQIEGDLLKAEAAFADADARLKEAQRDRDAALETINQHQIEFDHGVSDLRKRSTPGSRWNPGRASPEDALIVDAELMTDEAGSAGAERSAEAIRFRRADDRKSAGQDSPMVKIRI
jgi:hypothetical protein